MLDMARAASTQAVTACGLFAFTFKQSLVRIALPSLELTSGFNLRFAIQAARGRISRNCEK